MWKSNKNRHKSIATGIHQNRANSLPRTAKMSSTMTPRRKNKILFSVQSGSPAFLKKAQIVKTFSKFGTIKFIFFEPGHSWGWVQFNMAGAADKAENQLLSISTSTFKWEIHTFKDLSEMTAGQAVSHQILLESRVLPR